MKRILFFLLLLLNLQITIEKGFWGITPGEVSAQRMRDDHITDPYIWGGAILLRLVSTMLWRFPNLRMA